MKTIGSPSVTLPSNWSVGGPLQSYWVGIVPLVLVVALGLLLAMRRRSRRISRFHWRGAVAGLLGAVLVMFGAAGLVNAYVGYVPTFTAAARLVGLPRQVSGFLGIPTSSAGNVTTAVIAYPRNSAPPGTTWIYTPPGYARVGNTAHYPVVYLLHGHPGTSADWFAAGNIDTVMNELIRMHAMAPAIVVAPDMTAGGLRDTSGLNIVNGPQVATYLSSTVPGWVDSHFRTMPDPQHRVLGGMSSGGYAALNLGLQNQARFGGIIGLEPYGGPGASGLNLLGGSQASLHANSPSSFISTMTLGIHPPAVFIDVGSRSNSGPARLLATQLRARGIPVDYRVETGQRHTWIEAQAGIPHALTYLSHQLGWASGSLQTRVQAVSSRG